MTTGLKVRGKVGVAVAGGSGRKGRRGVGVLGCFFSPIPPFPHLPSAPVLQSQPPATVPATATATIDQPLMPT